MQMTDDDNFLDVINKEARELKDWARENYEINTPINKTLHPVIQDECDKMNKEFIRESKEIIFRDDE